MPPNGVFSGKKNWAWRPWEPETQSTCLCSTLETLEQFGHFKRGQVSKSCPVQYGEFYITKYFVLFWSSENQLKKKSNDQKLQQSACFKQNQEDAVGGLKFPNENLIKGKKKIPRNVSIHRRRSHNTKILTTSGWVTAAACDGYKKWCGFKAFILSSLLRFFCKIKGSLIQTSMKNGLCNIQGAGVWQTPQASH